VRSFVRPWSALGGEIDNRGRINLTLRGVPQAEEPAAEAPAE